MAVPSPNASNSVPLHCPVTTKKIFVDTPQEMPVMRHTGYKGRPIKKCPLFFGRTGFYGFFKNFIFFPVFENLLFQFWKINLWRNGFKSRTIFKFYLQVFIIRHILLNPARKWYGINLL